MESTSRIACMNLVPARVSQSVVYRGRRCVVGSTNSGQKCGKCFLKRPRLTDNDWNLFLTFDLGKFLLKVLPLLK